MFTLFSPHFTFHFFFFSVFPANPTKWTKKRNTESQIRNQKQKKKLYHRHHDDDGEEDEEDNQPNATEEENLDREDDSYDQSRRPNPRFGTNSQPCVDIEVVSVDGIQISQFPAAIKRTMRRPYSSVMAIVALERGNEVGDRNGELQNNAPFVENVSHGQLQALSSVPFDRGSNSSFVIALPPSLEGRGVVKRFRSSILVVPMHSDWFSPATVHRLGRQLVPHFFSGKSPDLTPQKCMDCRNCIVARYMEDPGKRITVLDCRGMLVGVDNEDLSLIVSFLNQWGIINYCAQGPSHEPCDSETYLNEETNGEIRVPSAALRCMDSLIKFDTPKCKSKRNLFITENSQC